MTNVPEEPWSPGQLFTPPTPPDTEVEGTTSIFLMLMFNIEAEINMLQHKGPQIYAGFWLFMVLCKCDDCFDLFCKMNGCRWCLNIDRRRGHSGRCTQFGPMTGTFFQYQKHHIPVRLMLIAHGNSEYGASKCIWIQEKVKRLAARHMQLARMERKRKREAYQEQFIRELAQRTREEVERLDREWSARTGIDLSNIMTGQPLCSSQRPEDVARTRGAEIWLPWRV